MRSMSGLLTMDEALELVLGRVRPLDVEQVELAAAAGRVLAEDIRATVDLPPFPSSAMDGFAVRAADTPGSLPIVARIAAGRPAERPLGAGEAMEISTGGVVPEGADAVVPIEVVAVKDNKLTVPDAAEPGAHVRSVGGDVRRGDRLLAAGTVLRPALVGALAAAGAGIVSCSLRPRVSVL